VAARTWTLRAVGLLLVGQTLVLGFGCAGKSERNSGSRGNGDDDSGGTGGTSSGGTAGTTPTGGVGPATGGSAMGGAAGAPTGGTAGNPTGGVSGDAGSTSGGASGTGAVAGEAGRPSTVIECETAEDCSIASDCCGCRAEPIRGPRLECPQDCARDACREGNIDRSELECVGGRCRFRTRCDGRNVTCPALPPNCGDDMVPSVVDDCWGPCLLPTDCSSVSSCTDCGDALCVEFEAQRTSYTCLERHDSCNASEDYCGCLGVNCAPCSASDPSVTCVCLVC
jgi:hypothetical protein